MERSSVWLADGVELAADFRAEESGDGSSVLHLQEDDSFALVARTWLRTSSVGWRPSTVGTVEGILRTHLLPAFGRLALSAITRGEILAFRARLVRENAGRQGAPQLSPARANRVIAVLRQILAETALQSGTPSAGAAVLPLQERRHAVRPFSWSEVERLIAAAPAHLAQYVRVRCLSGLRSGEINGLRWDQVDFEAGLVSITRARVEGLEVLPKNEYSERDIPLTQPLRAALAAQHALTGSADGYVFQTGRGRPIDTSNFANRDWPAMLAKADLAHRRPYQTRHTAATLMLAAGEDPQWIARVLGHADCQMLWRVYSRHIPNLTRRDGSAFEAALARLAA